MRILYVNPFSQQVSGPDESLLALLRHLVPRGIAPHVVLPADGPQVRRYQTLGAEVSFAPLTILHRNLSPRELLTFPARAARGASAIVRLARSIGAELIHTNMEVVMDGAFAAQRLGVPHVLHYRGNTLAQPRWIFAALTRLWSGLSARVFCISNATALSMFSGRVPGKVEVLYNPIETASFAAPSAVVSAHAVRRELGAAEGHLLVGTVGRIHPRKDVETFVRACAVVARQRPDVRFVVVGAAEVPVEHAYLKRVTALATELGVLEKICFAGARSDMPAVMQALDVFVLSSRHEGFGRVVGEALAAARPVVVTAEGALPELIEEGRCGLLAPPNDGAAFGERILHLLDRPALRAELGSNGVARARAFDAPAIADRVAETYRALVRRRSQQ